MFNRVLNWVDRVLPIIECITAFVWQVDDVLMQETVLQLQELQVKGREVLATHNGRRFMLSHSCHHRAWW